MNIVGDAAMSHCGQIAAEVELYLRLAVCIVPIIDQRQQQPHTILGSLIKDVIQSLEGMLTVLSCGQKGKQSLGIGHFKLSNKLENRL